MRGMFEIVIIRLIRIRTFDLERKDKVNLNYKLHNYISYIYLEPVLVLVQDLVLVLALVLMLSEI